jgi:hypothetical protein
VLTDVDLAACSIRTRVAGHHPLVLLPLCLEYRIVANARPHVVDFAALESIQPVIDSGDTRPAPPRRGVWCGRGAPLASAVVSVTGTTEIWFRWYPTMHL